MKQRYLSALCVLYTAAMCVTALPLVAQAAPTRATKVEAASPLDERSLTVYPNPSTGIVHLTISGLEGRKVDVSVLNVIGTVVYRESLTELNERFTKTLDLSRLANGLYYVRIEANSSSQLCKLVLH